MGKKYYLALILVLIPLFVLAACGGGGTTTTSTAAQATPTETPEPTPVEFTLTSEVFAYGAAMPGGYGYYGGNKSPQLSWSGAPEGTKSFALIMEDQNAVEGMFTHWVVYNIPSNVLELAEGMPATLVLSNTAAQGTNDFGGIGYGGPTPPPGTGVHQYLFSLYALDTMLDVPAGISKTTLINVMNGHILDTAEYMGTMSA